MCTIEILASGIIDDRDSAFPMTVQLGNDELLCSFSVGSGALVTGQTECARSADGGNNWTPAGVVLEKDHAQGRANFLKLTTNAKATTIYAYGAWIEDCVDHQFGQRPTTAVLCRSNDQGRSWSPAVDVLFPMDCPLEVSHGLLVLQSGRLLAPAAALSGKDTLGERVYLAVSDDDGQTWQYTIAFEDAVGLNGRRGFFEHKFVELAPDVVMGVCWTVTLGDYVDQQNTYVISRDGGRTFGPMTSTKIQGQTMTPISLGDDRLLVLYNKRHGQQEIRMCLVTWTDQTWTVHHESTMYNAASFVERDSSVESRIDEFDDFAFGYPTAIKLSDGTFLATHWCHEQGHSVIRWTRLNVAW
ncbi:MAG: glycoside hydrolase [Fuerstiella sp.]|nr:glycoside hydrolase [Fuerstiella sp.]